MEKVQHIQAIKYEPTTFVDTRTVGSSAPLRWLRQGIDDFVSAPLLSIGYGVVFALMAFGVSYASLRQPQLTLVFFTLLLSVGPFLATALYLVARSKQQGQSTSVGRSLKFVKKSTGRVGAFVLIMLLITVAWIRISTLLVALYSGQLAPGIEAFAGMLGSPDGLAFLGLVGAIAGLFAFLLFASSALTLPMIVDRKAELIPAFLTSMKTVFQQPRTMLVWAALIAGSTALGTMMLFVGLIFVFPVLGYATWHSYKELVE